MNSKERLDLKKLINESNCDDNTEKNRTLKHFELIFKDIQSFLSLKTKHGMESNFKYLCKILHPDNCSKNYEIVEDLLIINRCNFAITSLKIIENFSVIYSCSSNVPF